ncbi:MAG: WD40 domain protein beta Propeller [Candidatus Levybacteria bacterium GW2011_GWA2_40_8]|nr:MAG: WD40 domain protein beta Propeller [Candidatus Levybacteria bacterium GW2011_GWA2_40_8]
MIDGDTIKIENNIVVRYIGIDTPETVHPSKPVQCYGKEASDKNKELVEGKEVKLEKDVSETDKYDRLLRYVWLGDILVNEYLVHEGYAQSSSYPPDIKYQERFIEAQRQAREEKKGLWGDICHPFIKTAGAYTCNCSKTCSQIASCEEAQYQLNICGCKVWDADQDGIACDSECQ